LAGIATLDAMSEPSSAARRAVTLPGSITKTEPSGPTANSDVGAHWAGLDQRTVIAKPLWLIA